MTQKEFSAIAPTLPYEPGIYKYFDSSGQLIYVGKAKNLRKRISSYFTKTFTTYKTHELVKRIHHIEFTIVNSEQDAFLLEKTLIKEFQRPRDPPRRTRWVVIIGGRRFSTNCWWIIMRKRNGKR